MSGHYTLRCNSVREIFGSAIKFFTLEIRWADMSVGEEVEARLLFFVQKRHLVSIVKGKLGLSLNFYFGEQTFVRVSS